MRLPILALLLCGCTSAKYSVQFVDVDKPAPDSVHVCLVNAGNMQCMTIQSFMKVVQQKQESSVPTREL